MCGESVGGGDGVYEVAGGGGAEVVGVERVGERQVFIRPAQNTQQKYTITQNKYKYTQNKYKSTQNNYKMYTNRTIHAKWTTRMVEEMVMLIYSTHTHTHTTPN